MRALKYAVIRNDISKVIELLTKDNVNNMDIRKNTPLIFSVTGDVTIVKLLLDLGANIDHQNIYGMTALMDAVVDRFEATKLLIAQGADINITDLCGNTALIWAARLAKNIDIIKYLLKAGADPAIKNMYGMSAFMYAFNRGFVEALDLLIYAEYNGMSYI